MSTRPITWVALAALAGLLAATAPADDKKPDVDKIPKAVMQTLKAKFPKADITKWTEETEDGKKVYDIEFKQGEAKFEADIFEDGTIHNWEEAIPAKDLPEAVTKAVDKKYPKATLKDVMRINSVKDKKDVLEGYEITLETADKKEVELTVAPDGKIVEDSSEVKKEEKKPDKE